MKSLEFVQRKSLIDPNFLKSQDLGEITPAFYRSGPTQTRSCTDILCLLIFWIISICLLIIIVLALFYGDPKLLYVGYDISNNPCGIDAYSDYPFLYFYNTTQQKNGAWSTICVTECPMSGNTTIDCGVNNVITKCSNASISVYETESYMGFLCLPTNTTIYEKIQSALTITGVTGDLFNIWNNWRFELIFMGFAYVVGIIFVFLATCIPHIVIVIFIIFVFVGLLCFGSLLMVAYAEPSLIFQTTTNGSENIIKNMLNDISTTFCLVSGIVFYVSCFIFSVCMIVFRTKIKLLMIILKSTALFIRARKLFPFISFAFFLILIGYLLIWLMTSIYLYTWIDSDYVDNTIYSTPFNHFHTYSIANLFLIIHCVSLFWNLAFIFTTYSFLLKSSCVFWYFSHGDSEEHTRKIPHPLGLALKLYFRYHFGSIAQGTFLLLLFRGFNASFGYCYNKITDYGRETSNKCQQFTIKTCVCFLILYEKIFRYINRETFVQMTMSGKNFLNSARDSFYLIKRNEQKYEMIEGLGHLVLWLGKLFICLLTTLLAFIASTQISYFSSNISDPMIPLGIILIISFLLGNIIMNLVATITDTLIFIYLLDEEIERVHYNELNPRSAPEELREFMRETVMEINENKN